MKTNASGTIVILAVIALCIAVVGSFGKFLGASRVCEEAVLKGHAEWVADANGKPQFKWKECK
jgi:hypothetical protein